MSYLSELHRKMITDIDGYESGDGYTHKLVEYHRESFECCECELTIRPIDNAFVVHLKYLPPILRQPRFFDYACKFWRKRIGAFKGFEAYYTDKVDDANELYSLDMIFIEYYPAIMGDVNFMKRHAFKIAGDMNREVVGELQGHAVRKGFRREDNPEN